MPTDLLRAEGLCKTFDDPRARLGPRSFVHAVRQLDLVLGRIGR
jgi:hypothetical protein